LLYRPHSRSVPRHRLSNRSRRSPGACCRSRPWSGLTKRASGGVAASHQRSSPRSTGRAVGRSRQCLRPRSGCLRIYVGFRSIGGVLRSNSVDSRSRPPQDGHRVAAGASVTMAAPGSVNRNSCWRSLGAQFVTIACDGYSLCGRQCVADTLLKIEVCF